MSGACSVESSLHSSLGISDLLLNAVVISTQLFDDRTQMRIIAVVGCEVDLLWIIAFGR